MVHVPADHLPTDHKGAAFSSPMNPTVLRCEADPFTHRFTLAGIEFLTVPVASCAPQIPFTHFLALSGAELAGAFLGACLVFLHYVRRSMEGSHLQPQ